MRVNFEIDWMSASLGAIMLYLGVQIRKIFRLWKIKEHGSAKIVDVEYEQLAGALSKLADGQVVMAKNIGKLVEGQRSLVARICQLESRST